MSTEKKLTAKQKLELEEMKRNRYNIILVIALLVATFALIFGNFIFEQNNTPTESKEDSHIVDDLPAKNYE